MLKTKRYDGIFNYEHNIKNAIYINNDAFKGHDDIRVETLAFCRAAFLKSTFSSDEVLLPLSLFNISVRLSAVCTK